VAGDRNGEKRTRVREQAMDIETSSGKITKRSVLVNGLTTSHKRGRAFSLGQKAITMHGYGRLGGSGRKNLFKGLKDKSKPSHSERCKQRRELIFKGWKTKVRGKERRKQVVSTHFSLPRGRKRLIGGTKAAQEGNGI